MTDILHPDPTRLYPTVRSCRRCGHTLYRIGAGLGFACAHCNADWEPDDKAFATAEEFETPVDKL